MSVLQKRLENDFKELSQLERDSGGTLFIVSKTGKPPNQYIIEYRCRGIERLQETQPVFRTTHRVEITLLQNYPKEKPMAKFLTPIFHPNIYVNRQVCLGSYWTMSETLCELVQRIGKIIQYSTDVLNLGNPANALAAKWALSYQQLFPVDTQTFKKDVSCSGIVWNDI